MEKEQVLGWYKFPEPEGTKFGKEDFEDKEKIEQLFKYCQQGLGIIKAKGWEFLVVEFGLEGVMEIDAQSKWMYEEDKGEWLRTIFLQSLTAGYDPESGELGDYDMETKNFYYEDGTARLIDWDAIYEFKNQL